VEQSGNLGIFILVPKNIHQAALIFESHSWV